MHCDKRRPDLAKSFFQTVCCIKEIWYLLTHFDTVREMDLAAEPGREMD
jgi:hypothetical protein